MTGDTKTKTNNRANEQDNNLQALLNVLTDYKEIETASARSRRAMLNILEDLEESNSILHGKTQEMAVAADALLQKKRS